MEAFLDVDTLEDNTTEPIVVIVDESGNEASVRIVDFLLLHSLEESDLEAYATLIDLATVLHARLPSGGLNA